MEWIYQIFITHNRPWSKAEMFYLLLIVFVTEMVLILGIFRNHVRISQAAAFLLMVLFLEIVYASTVLTRNTGVRSYKLIPCWSWYKVLVEKDVSLFWENILNLILLIPAGFLLPFICNHKVLLQRGGMVGIVISSTIEIGQLVLKRGLFEWDDIIHNTLGCMLGCYLANWIWGRIEQVLNYIKKRG